MKIRHIIQNDMRGGDFRAYKNAVAQLDDLVPQSLMKDTKTFHIDVPIVQGRLCRWGEVWRPNVVHFCLVKWIREALVKLPVAENESTKNCQKATHGIYFEEAVLSSLLLSLDIQTKDLNCYSTSWPTTTSSPFYC